MSYDYKTMRPQLFTEDGLSMLIAIRAYLRPLIRKAGAVTMGAAIRGAKSGDSWMMIACVDRLVEMKELREIPTKGVGQDRVFVPGSQWVAR